MTEALLPVGIFLTWATAWWGARQQAAIYRRAWDAEAAEVKRLQTLLMARSAPQEFAAYIDPPAEDKTEWLFTEDGLHGVPLDPDDA